MPGPEEIKCQARAGSSRDFRRGATAGLVVGMKVPGPWCNDMGIARDQRHQALDQLLFVRGNRAIGKSQANNIVALDAEAFQRSLLFKAANFPHADAVRIAVLAVGYSRNNYIRAFDSLSGDQAPSAQSLVIGVRGNDQHGRAWWLPHRETAKTVLPFCFRNEGDDQLRGSPLNYNNFDAKAEEMCGPMWAADPCQATNDSMNKLATRW